MLIPLEQCIEICNKPINGILHFGANTGKEAQMYHDNNIKNVIWLEANKELMKPLYDETKFVPIYSKYSCYAFSNENNVELNLNVADNNNKSSTILNPKTFKIQYGSINFPRKIPTVTKRFDKFYREKMFDINLDEYNFISLGTNGTELKILEGFGNLFERFDFKGIYTKVYFEELFEDCGQIEETDKFLSKFGFERVLTTSPEETWGEALFVRQ